MERLWVCVWMLGKWVKVKVKGVVSVCFIVLFRKLCIYKDEMIIIYIVIK